MSDELAEALADVPATQRSTGARFFDERHRDRGQAVSVVRRVRAIDGLTTLDITTTDRPLAEFLGGLDKARLRVEPLDGSDEGYSFTWASGYDRGNTIRVHGSLDTMPWPGPRRP
jgi:hypothetical protein